MATLTMKKSRTTMKVPVRTTARAAHRCDDARAVLLNGGANSCALMIGTTVPAGLTRVDYLAGRCALHRVRAP
jgi:hypothetical protein